MRRVTVLTVTVLVCLAIGAVPASADNPTFEVYFPDNIVEPGEETELSFEIRNGADPGVDATARNIEVTLEDSNAPVTVQSDTVPLTQMGPGSLANPGFTVAVHDDAETGTYNLQVEISYEYTTPWGSTRSDTDVEFVTIRVDERARFSAVDVSSNVVVGDQGTVELTLNNTGSDNASNAVVTFASADPDATAISATTSPEPANGAAAYVGRWERNETKTVTAGLEITETAVPRTYPLTATVEFRDEDGIDRTSREVRVGVPVAPAQSFSIEDTESDLWVGEDGTVRGEFVNEGPRPIENAVLILPDGSGSQIIPDIDEGLGTGPNVHPRETQYALGSLDVGERVPIELHLGISQDAIAGPRVVAADVRYRYPDDTPSTTTNPVDVRVDVAPSRDEFNVTATGTTIAAGSTRTIDLEITNTRSTQMAAIEAKLFPNSPLESSNDEAFVPSLGPGESTTLQFEVTVASGASPQTYPLRMDFRYEEEGGDVVLSDMYRIPVTVTTPSGGIVSGSSVLLSLLVLAIGFGISFRFRNDLAPAVDRVPVPTRLRRAGSSAFEWFGETWIGGLIDRGTDDSDDTEL